MEKEAYKKINKTENKKYAVLILAHKNVGQVKRLIRTLQNPMIDIYIHCDKRWDEGYFSLKKEGYPNVYFTDNRVCSDLDTWELVQAPMNLINKSKEINRDGYKYYILISGQDYPLARTEEILDKLEQSYPKPFIDCTPYDENNWLYHKFKSASFFNKFRKFIDNKMKKGLLRKAIKFPLFLINRLSKPKKELDKLGVDLYGGSAWWILPDIVIDYILDEYINQDKYLKILSRTKTPEETFFQIMTMKSPCAGLVEINPKDMVLQNCKTFAYFFDEDKPFTGHPYVFTMSDTDKLKEVSKNAFFARKFDEKIDKAVFEWIDRNLHI